jgi:hypothetical protein
MGRDFIDMRFENLWQDVPALDHDLPLPAEVVEADMVETDRGRFHPEQTGEEPLEPDRDVTQPDRALPSVQERSGHNANRIREVDQPGRWRHRRHRGRDVQGGRHRAQCLGEASCTGGLLTDAAELEWQ